MKNKTMLVTKVFGALLGRGDLAVTLCVDACAKLTQLDGPLSLLLEKRREARKSCDSE